MIHIQFLDLCYPEWVWLQSFIKDGKSYSHGIAGVMVSSFLQPCLCGSADYPSVRRAQEAISHDALGSFADDIVDVVCGWQ